MTISLYDDGNNDDHDSDDDDEDDDNDVDDEVDADYHNSNESCWGDDDHVEYGDNDKDSIVSLTWSQVCLAHHVSTLWILLDVPN